MTSEEIDALPDRRVAVGRDLQERLVAGLEVLPQDGDPERQRQFEAFRQLVSSAALVVLHFPDIASS